MFRISFLILAALAMTSGLASAQTPFVRGDCNGDQAVGISDPVALLGYLFSGGEIGCESACDANDDGAVQLTDAIVILDSLFGGTGALPAPYPSCGVDPTVDSLGCDSTPCPVGPATDNLREVDVVYLGPTLSGDRLLVSVAGSGAQHQLSSWTVPSGGSQPALADTAEAVDGHHAQVESLPATGLLTGQPRFASAAIREDGNLWITSQRLGLAAQIASYGTVGYGENADVQVLGYDIASRPIYSGFVTTDHQVVTAVVTEPIGGGTQSIRIVSWSIDPSDGSLTGVDDSGSLPFSVPQFMTADELNVNISHQNGIQYVLTFTNASDELENHFFWVDNGGDVVYAGGAEGGRNLRGSSDVSIEQEASAVAPVTESGFVTANRQLDGTLSMSVWERRAVGFLNFEPYQISDNSHDLVPDSKGMFVAIPELNDSFTYPGSSGDLAGHELAVGDFNGDGLDDAVIAAPFRSAGGEDNAGVIFVIHGSNGSGIYDEEYTQVWSQATPGVAGAHEEDDRFGETLAVGDFNGDGLDDLAVTTLNEAVGATPGGGAVSILYGTVFGLSTTGNFIFTQEDLGYTTNNYDYFGYSLAAGDFDGDGRDDLAMGCPHKEIGGHINGGVVYVAWGSGGGLSMSGATLLHQDSTGIFQQVEDSDQFGLSLAAGDLNGDGRDDLAVGVPREDIGAASNAGGVHVFYGSDVSSTGFGFNSFVSQGGFTDGEEIIGAVEAGDEFGMTLAIGDFNDDGASDLAIGVPGESVGALSDSGAINVLYGTIFGVTHFNNLVITQNTFNPIGGSLPGSAGAGDEFGDTLTVGDFNGDGYVDLVAGAPRKDLTFGCSTEDNAGAAFVIYGSATGLTATGSQRIDQSNCSAAGSAVSLDRYAYALAAGDFDADGEDDLLVGVPEKDRGDKTNVGAAHILSGSPDGVSFTGDEEWYLRQREVVRARVTDLTREDDGEGAGSLYSKGTALAPVHVASVTKCMTLLLAVEALEAGQVDLDDMIDISDLAGGTGGSYMELWDEDGIFTDDEGDKVRFIQPGDTMPLRLLLHGMMMRSGNRCSVAIGQHVAQAATGSPDEFVNMMNDRAVELGMDDSICGHPAGGMATKTQDLINLLVAGWEYPLFRQISSIELYGDLVPSIDSCGTDSMGAEKCNGPFGKIATIGSYPGRLGYKGGGGRLWWNSSVPYGYQGAQPPGYCTAAAVAIVERADRQVAIALQQSGSKTGDSQRLLDYGFRQIFTPDRCATREFPTTGGILGPGGPIRVRAFALDSIGNDRCVTAIIDDNEELRLNLWGADFATGEIDSLGTASETYSLLAGPTFAETPLVRMTRVPSGGDSIADFFTANLIGEQLDLQIWRVGNQP